MKNTAKTETARKLTAAEKKLSTATVRKSSAENALAAADANVAEAEANVMDLRAALEAEAEAIRAARAAADAEPIENLLDQVESTDKTVATAAMEAILRRDLPAIIMDLPVTVAEKVMKATNDSIMAKYTAGKTVAEIVTAAAYPTVYAIADGAVVTRDAKAEAVIKYAIGVDKAKKYTAAKKALEDAIVTDRSTNATFRTVAAMKALLEVLALEATATAITGAAAEAMVYATKANGYDSAKVLLSSVETVNILRKAVTDRSTTIATARAYAAVKKNPTDTKLASRLVAWRATF